MTDNAGNARVVAQATGTVTRSRGVAQAAGAVAKGRGVALVTGASSGIGSATAAALARRGWRVVVHGRDEKAVQEVAHAVCGVPVCADLAQPEEVERLAEFAMRTGEGRVGVLVNNAAIGWSGPFEAMDAETRQQVLAVDLAAPIALTRALLPGMREHGAGRLVFISSIAGRLGVGNEAVYSAAKAGLDCFAGSLRSELRGTGIEVSVVVPGVVATPFFDRRGTPYTRNRPRPLPPSVVGDAVVRCVEGHVPEVYVPRWLRLPVAVRGVAPGLYRRLAERFGA